MHRLMAGVELGLPRPRLEHTIMEGLHMVGNTAQCRPWGLTFKVRGRPGQTVAAVITRFIEIVDNHDIEVEEDPGNVEERCGHGCYTVRLGPFRGSFVRATLSVTLNGDNISGSPVNLEMIRPEDLVRIRPDHQPPLEGRSWKYCSVACFRSGLLAVTVHHPSHSPLIIICDQAGHVKFSETIVGAATPIPSLPWTEVPIGIVEWPFANNAAVSTGGESVQIYSQGQNGTFRRSDEKLFQPIATASGPSKLLGVCADHRQRLLVADATSHTIRVRNVVRVMPSIGSEGGGEAQFHQPRLLHLDSAGKLYVGDHSLRMQVFARDAETRRTMLKFDLDDRPTGVAVTNDGFIFVTYQSCDEVHVYSPLRGQWVYAFPVGRRREGRVSQPAGIAIAQDGFSILVADRGDDSKIVRV